MSWINDVVLAHCESEAPSKFFYWAAVSSISAVVRKNIFLERFYYKLYPNVYVFIVAKSGMKKGIPVNLAKTLTTKANVSRIISGRNSMQRILQDLGKAFSLEGGGMIKDAQGFLISGELAAFLLEDRQALTILTDLHDTHAYEEKWINSLKTAGVDTLKAPCLTLLGATNEEHFADAVPANAIGGGFIARTFIVYSEEKGSLNSLTQPPKKVVNTDDFVPYLKRLAELKGEMKWGEGAADVYDDWYYPFMREERFDPTGTFNRIGDQALKLAMIISLSESDKLVLEVDHVLEGIEQATSCVVGMQQITMGTGQAQFARQTKMVLRELLRTPEHQIQKNRLLQKFWGEMDVFDLDRIAESLQQQNAIHIIQQGKVTTYVMLKQAVEMYNTFYNHIKRDIQ